MFHRAVLTAVFCLACLPAQAELPTPVAERLAKANLPQDAIGAVVLRVADGAMLVSHNPDASMQPASTMKIVSTVIGLDRLGPMFRGRTLLQSDAPVRNGRLKGDLVLRGGADVDLNAQALEDMLQTLRNSGIRQIDGDVLIDRGLYQPARLDLGVGPFDDAPEFRYNVIPDALGLNLNLLRLELRADQKTLSVHMQPALERVSVTHDMTLVDAACKDWDNGWKPATIERKRGNIRIVLHGTFPKDCMKTPELNLLDRTEFADRLFRSLWKRLGGSLRGDVREGSGAPGLPVLAEHKSRPLAEVIRDINKMSDNTFARMLMLNMGTFAVDSPVTGNVSLLAAEPASTLQRAEREMRGWFRQHGIDDGGLVLDNGSGLSRSERIRPAQLAAVLKVAQESIWAPELMASLPLGGMDGTMRARLKDSTAAGRARIKTGALRNAAAVAGYVLDAQGRQCIVVGMINAEAMKGSEARATLDALIDWVAHSGG